MLKLKDKLPIIITIFSVLSFLIINPLSLKLIQAEEFFVTGLVYTPLDTPAENIFAYLFDYELVKIHGLSFQSLEGATKSLSTDPKGRLDPPLKLITGKEYFLIFSTRKYAGSHEYPDFFLGKRGSSYVSDPNLVLANAPTLRYDSSIESLGKIYIPDNGYFFSGLIKDQNDQPLSGIRVEIYLDSMGYPARVDYPFYRYVVTNSNSESNFKIGGILPDVKYYIKAIGSHKEYVDTFFINEYTAAPESFQIETGTTGKTLYVGELQMRKGGKIYGFIKDYFTDNPVDFSSSMLIADVTTVENNLESTSIDFFALYDNPTGLLNDAYPFEWDRNYFKLYFKYDHVYDDANARYELKGLPLDKKYILKIVESPTKNYATPAYFYNGDYIVYYKSFAKTIDFLGGINQHRIDFRLKPGRCIEGNVSFNVKIGEEAQNLLKQVDPNFFNSIPILVDIHRIEPDGTISKIDQRLTVDLWSADNRDYTFCGLPPGSYQVKAYDGYSFYYEKYYNNVLTFSQQDNDPNYYTGIDIPLTLGGMMSFKVYGSDTGEFMPDVGFYVFQVDLSNPLKGYIFDYTTGNRLSVGPPLYILPDNDLYLLWGLPAGTYSIQLTGYTLLKNKGNAYLPQFCDPNAITNDPNAKLFFESNSAPVIEITGNDPNFMKFKVYLKNIKDESGGIISGRISPKYDDGYFFRVYDADTMIEISNILTRQDPNNSGDSDAYLLMIPKDGRYILTLQDALGDFLPHYYNSIQSSIDPESAEILTINSNDPATKFLTNIDFSLVEKGCWVSGRVLNQSGEGLYGLTIHGVHEIKEGLNKGIFVTLNQVATTQKNGEFILKGLYPEECIFFVNDPFYIYAGQYFHSDPNIHVFTTDEAEIIVLSLDDPNRDLTFHLQKGGRVAGTVENARNAQIYARYLTDPLSDVFHSTYDGIADPNFILTGIFPGYYKVDFYDTDLDYLPLYYNRSGGSNDPNESEAIEVKSGETAWLGNINFIGSGATIEGMVGEVTATGGVQRLANIYVFIYNLYQGDKISSEAKYSLLSDQNGSYSFKNILKGDYWIGAVSPQRGPLFKKVTVDDSDLGEIIQGVDIVYPSDREITKREYTISLKNGLNLIAFPTHQHPFLKYSSDLFLRDISLVGGSMEMIIKTYFPEGMEWASTTFDGTLILGIWANNILGGNFQMHSGQGFLFYGSDERDIEFWFYPNQVPLDLYEGLNLVGNIVHDPQMASFIDTNILDDQNFTTKKMLSQLGEDSAFSVHTLDAPSSRWQTTYWMWGRPAGANTQIEDTQGYLVNMKKDKPNWYPKQWGGSI